jgi:GrpB-like predicted nucleotidyltransferase (UPF0157 family)
MAALILVEYQSDWPSQFAEVAGELRGSFAGSSVVIEHIGSTSVPGLCAKPVLDLLLGAESLSVIEFHVPGLVRIGFAYRPEHEASLPERRYFVRGAGTLPRIHLHAVVLNAPIWQQHLAFRDALRSSRQLSEEYAGLKRALAAVHGNDKSAYTAAKAPFIARVLASLPALGGVALADDGC